MSDQNEQTSRPDGTALPPPSRLQPPVSGDGNTAEKESKVYPITAEVEELSSVRKV